MTTLTKTVLPRTIRKAAVIGAGTMGAGIAAQLANAGVPVLLLDLPAEGADRNAIVKKALERLKASKPAALMSPDRVGLIEIGNTEDDLGRVREADWIVEAVLERLDIKQALLEKLEQTAREDALITSNSSGIPMKLQAKGRSEGFRRRFFGTHFFNPPRYLHLLEIIPGPDTGAEVIELMRGFGDHVLGKGVVLARDVPGFAANRVGAYAWLQAIHAAVELGLTPDVVDLLTGPLIGHPKSATFRTADMSGLDIVYTVAKDLGKATGEDFPIPRILETLVTEKKWLGDKTGQGFYKKVKGSDGESVILTLNFKTMEYEKAERVALPEVDDVKKLATPIERLARLLDAEGKVGDFMRRVTFRAIHYAASKVGEVADTAEDVDNAVRWGFNYEMGYLETARALGEDRVRRGLEREGLSAIQMPPARQETRPDAPILLRDARKVVKENADASLLDLGDGVALLEFHSKANSIGQGVLEMTGEALEIVGRDFAGLVIGNQGSDFSVGANLMMVVELAQKQQWDMLEEAVAVFQRLNTKMRYSPFPVVVAPHHKTLGGGCEMSLWADAVQADAELYMGLVEIGVGLIPAAGGTTEMLIRFQQQLMPGADPFLAVRRAFEVIGMAKTSASALDARAIGYLRPSDGISMNGDRVITDAKRRVLQMIPGYVAPTRRQVTLLGESAYATLGAAILGMRSSAQISDYDGTLARTLGTVLCGGTMNRPSVVDEQVVLDYEREAFMKLCREEKTQQRIMHTLKTGKPLRN
ncbi:MAG: 3-hydroxyacyl-CoA dehydrogenase/enoyl-CoA hydratase family protein [Candidatus Xenobia bacterium]